MLVSQAGDEQTAKARALTLAAEGRAYAIYVNGGTRVELILEMPGGDYNVEWIDTKTGRIKKSEKLSHDGGDCALVSPDYSEDIALRVVL